MIKYLSSAVTFAEFPDEISLNLNITGCPCNCDGCSEPELRPDVGTPVTVEEIAKLVEKNPGITMIGFMGGDRYHSEIVELARAIHDRGLKVGMYSGQEYLDMNLLGCLDYYKIGAFRMFTGPEETWKDQTAGPIVLPTSNQIMFKRVDNRWINITNKFRTKKINNWKKTIL